MGEPDQQQQLKKENTDASTETERSESQPGSPHNASKPERKPWKKKSPVEVVLEQADKLKAEIAEMEEEIKAKRKQLAEVRRGQEAVRRDVAP